MEGQVHSARTRAHNPARSTHHTPAGLPRPAIAPEDPQAARLPTEQEARAESETALFLKATSMKGNAYSSVQELRRPDHQTNTRTAATSTVEIQPQTRAQARTAHTMPRTAFSVSCSSTDSIRSQGHVCKTGPHIDADESVSPRSALPSQEQGQGAQNPPAIGHQVANPMAAVPVRQYVEVVAEPKVQIKITAAMIIWRRSSTTAILASHIWMCMVKSCSIWSHPLPCHLSVIIMSGMAM